MERSAGELKTEAASLFGWWEEAGVDILVDERPRDWLQPVAAAAASPLSEEPAPRSLPETLDALKHHLATQADLPFAGPGATRVLPAGDPASGLMFLADMPSSEDAAAGQVFAGETGRLFDNMLRAIGRTRGDVYLASLSCLAAPTGRLDEEAIGACADLARHHVALATPKRLLLLGDAACRAILGTPLMPARGRVHHPELGPKNGNLRVPTVATFHPRFLLTSPSAKAGAWADLLLFTEDLA